jgi:hypothetical protein
MIDFDQGFGRACTRTFQQASARGCAPDRDRPIVSNTQSMCFARIVAKIVRDLEVAARETPNFEHGSDAGEYRCLFGVLFGPAIFSLLFHDVPLVLTKLCTYMM